MLERWTRAVLRLRLLVLLCWLAVLAVGVVAALRLPALLSNSFVVPGSQSDRARVILQRHFGERPDGSFTVVFRVRRPGDKAVQAAARRRLARAARVVPTGRVGPLRPGGGVLWGEVDTTLDLQHAKGYTEAVRRALQVGSGAPALVTGQPAIQHDLDPVFRSDLRRGEAVAIPAALLVLVALLGLSLAVAVPFVFAACTIGATFALLWPIAHATSVVSYVLNLVELIGLGLAIDYSLLVVHRFREELARGDDVDEAVVRTMATAGRAVVFSGVAVAIGLGLILFVPVPFLRAVGIGGALVPVVSVAAALTLQPVLLRLGGRRLQSRRAGAGRRFWERLAAAIMRRPFAFLAVGASVLVAAAVPSAFLRLTPASISGIPSSLEAVRAYDLLQRNVGAGVVLPIEVVIDAGSPGAARSPAVRRAVARLEDELVADGEVLLVADGPGSTYVDASGRYRRVIVGGRHDYGEEATQQLVRRVRDVHVPDAHFPSGTTVVVGGAPAEGVDFLDRSYDSFPWLVLGVLGLTYLVLVRAFRSVLLPLKAVLLNILTVAAVYGLLVVVFRWGVGADVLGLYRAEQVDGWVPIFLFATLFGLSMDYEVFMVSRMRETWDETGDNAYAVGHGLERTGRIVTAAALIMVAAFSGFVVGRVAALQEFGLGLALAVLIDATIVRAVLVPALMAILGRWNWWLPRRWVSVRARSA